MRRKYAGVIGAAFFSKSGRIVGAAALAMSLVACDQARKAEPVHMMQPKDEQLNCSDIKDEQQKNLKAVDGLLKRHADIVRGRYVAGFINFGLIGLLQGMMPDMSNTEKVEGRALIDRNERLDYLAQSKGCGET
jgi:hypothetical protein